MLLTWQQYVESSKCLGIRLMGQQGMTQNFHSSNNSRGQGAAQDAIHSLWHPGQLPCPLIARDQPHPKFANKVVSSAIKANHLTTSALFQYFTQLVRHLENGTTMADMAYISTSAANLKLFMYNNEGDVLDALQATKDAGIIPKVTCVPVGDMPQELLTAQTSTKHGLLLVFKPADQLTATLLLMANNNKRKALISGGKQLHYTTDTHSSVKGTPSADPA